MPICGAVSVHGIAHSGSLLAELTDVRAPAHARHSSDKNPAFMFHPIEILFKEAQQMKPRSRQAQGSSQIPQILLWVHALGIKPCKYVKCCYMRSYL